MQVVTQLVDGAHKVLQNLVYKPFNWTELLLLPPIENVRNILDYVCALRTYKVSGPLTGIGSPKHALVT
jgi:hypothetical protein